jgi:transcriptional regulator with XRE-family HTH domain
VQEKSLEKLTVDADRVRRRMRDLGLEAVRLADKLGVSESALSVWLSGGGIKASNLKALADALDRPADWILGIDQEHDANRPASMLNESASSESKDASLKMFAEQTEDFRKALDWLIGRLNEDELEVLHTAAFKDKALPRVRKKIITDHIFLEQERRQEAATVRAHAKSGKN